MVGRTRLDELVVSRGLAVDLSQSKRLILGGEIWSAGRRLDKAGMVVSADVELEHRPGRSGFVSRGGEKLAGALDALDIDVGDLVCLDLGASTGGFTDCLLQRGAARVVAVDVGRGQLDWRLRNDDRVTVVEGCNVRFLKPEDLPVGPQLVTADLSFISLRLILPVIRRVAAPALVLVKPQFEARPEEVEKGGLIRNPELREEILLRLEDAARSAGFRVRARVDSVLAGKKGNLEAFLWLE